MSRHGLRINALVAARPHPRLGAWIAPRHVPWVGIIVLIIACIVTLGDVRDAWKLMDQQQQLEQTLAKRRPGLQIASKPLLLATSAVSQRWRAYQTPESWNAWSVLGEEFQHDPAALFIAVENTLVPDIGVLSLDWQDNQSNLMISIEAKTVDAVEAWRKAVDQHPLMKGSRFLKEKQMPDQYGAHPSQLSFEVGLNWAGLTDTLNSLPSQQLKKNNKKEEKGSTKSYSPQTKQHRKKS